MKQLRGFAGSINYYRDMWPHRSHIMAPLTTQTGAFKKGEIKTLKWTDKMQDSLSKTKALIATYTMLPTLIIISPFTSTHMLQITS